LVRSFIGHGISSGNILEAGCGTGILGIKVVKYSKPQAVHLTGVDLSADMIAVSIKNAQLADVSSNCNFIQSNLEKLPFPDNYFDGIMSNGSFHHWKNPVKVLNELKRVLKTDGRIVINDIRRDINRQLVFALKLVLNHWQRERLDESVNAAYTPDECEEILRLSGINGLAVKKGFMEFMITWHTITKSS
jgi:ubiquinone/menaquinone biosynthesis C-methylase UbiE